MDTQRHITSRTYESFCYDARIKLLSLNGYPVSRLLEERMVLSPVRSEARFIQQQYAGAKLSVVTDAFPGSDGEIIWEQEVRQSDKKIAAKLRTVTTTLQSGSPVSLLGEKSKKIKSTSGGRKKEKLHQSKSEMFEPIVPFSGNCRRTSNSCSIGFSDRDIFGIPYISSLWKIFEESRWRLSQEKNLTLENFIQMDTIVFFMGGRVDILTIPLPGERLTVHTWVRNIGGIRFNFVHEVENADGDILMRMQDDQLVVSVSKTRPKRPPPEFLKMIEEYVEKQP